MAIEGTNGTGNQFVDRFSAGGAISASQLNDLINGISTTLPQPYLGDGPTISYGSGGTVITAAQNDPNQEISFSLSLTFGGESVNHWEIGIVGFGGGTGILSAALKVAKGGNVWRPAGSECDKELRADDIMTDGTITVIPGALPTSPWASNDGHILMTIGTTYFVYAFKLETEFATAFYIYVSTDGTLVNSCPVAMPPGFSPPDIPYDFQGILVGSAVVTAPFLPVVDQKVIGSITWPNLPPPPVYVNHYEAAVEKINIDGTMTNVLKVGRGGNVWNPSTSTKQNALEKRVDVLTSGPDVYAPTAGTNANSPWASDDGYIVLEGVNVYVYAFKVTYSFGNESDFYIYVSEADNLVDPVGGRISIPSGITPPSGDYTVQGVRVADVIRNLTPGEADYNISQRVVGSITWPDYIPAVPLRQFEVVVPPVDSETVDPDSIQIVKGNIIWTNSRWGYTRMDGGSMFNPVLQGEAKKVWVYPTGSLTDGGDSASPFMNNGGRIHLERGTTYFVYIIGNQDSEAAGSSLGNVTVAVIADGSDANNKTKPFDSGYMGRNWATAATPFLEVDGVVYGLGGIDVSSNWPYNFNCQRYLVATVFWNETRWVVNQQLFGPVTLSDDLIYMGCRYVVMEEPGAPWPRDFLDQQNDWSGAWSGYTKDGNPENCTVPVRVYP